jgi:hypothetical protein
MNKLITLAALALLSSPVIAHDWDGNPDMEKGILNVHPEAFVGTSFSSRESVRERGEGEAYGSVLLDVAAGKIGTSGAREKGEGDAYGSILLDVR